MSRRENEGNEVLVELLLLIGSLSLYISFVFHDAYGDRRERENSVAEASSAERVH